MFTGIIEECGRLEGLQRGAQSAVLRFAAEKVLVGVRLGDSIAVNGVCLTVTSFDVKHFTADVMHETLRRSSLGSLTSGSIVNLERAMAANGRFGGHIVSGHIDGVGTVTQVRRDDNAVWYRIRCPEAILRYIIEKGSIAIDGISLTVAALGKQDFSVSVIPHTARHTTLSQRRVGDTVNLENDCIGKYVERLLSGGQASGGISKEYLQNYGF